MRAVLDTNVLVSGIHWKGASSKVIEAILANKFESVTSEEILREFVEVMQCFKISMPNDEIIEWENLVMSKSEIVLPKQRLYVVKDDPDDNKFVEAAVKATVIILSPKTKSTC